MFQSTRPRGARQRQRGVLPHGVWEFQSTRPRGARLGGMGLVEEETKFQSTRPRGARPVSHFVSATSSVFQSTRPRGARPFHRDTALHELGVSIHAPAWGATHPVRRFRQSLEVSIHAPAWGATRRVVQDLAACLVSIHAPAWGATTEDAVNNKATIVSIHAPAWGATTAPTRSVPARRCFNPRARVGRDARPQCGTLVVGLFQSTRPRGARQSSASWRSGSGSFNPRARVGRDQPAGESRRGGFVSIHAPAWGATGVLLRVM